MHSVTDSRCASPRPGVKSSARNTLTCRSQLDERGAESELHPVGEMTLTDDMATVIALGRTEFLHLDVVYAIRRAEAVAVCMRRHRQRLLWPEPRQNM